MAERFTLQIFADTSQAAAELKRFAAEQDATAKKLRSKANQPGSSGYIAPRPTIQSQARSLGATSAQVQRQQQSGQTSSTQAAAQQAEIARQRQALSRTAQETLGISSAEADKFVADQERRGRLEVAQLLKFQKAALEKSVQGLIVDAEAQAAATAAKKAETAAARTAAAEKAAAAATERTQTRAGRDAILAGSPEHIEAERAAAEAAADRKRSVQAATAETRRREAVATAILRKQEQAARDQALAADPTNKSAQVAAAQAAAARKAADREATAATREKAKADRAVADAAEANRVRVERDSRLATDPAHLLGAQDAATASAQRKKAEDDATRDQREKAKAERDAREAVSRRRAAAERDARLATDPVALGAEHNAAAAAAERKRANAEATAGVRVQAATQRKVDSINQAAAVNEELTSTEAGRAAIDNAELQKARRRQIEATSRAAAKAELAGPQDTTRFQRFQGRVRGQPAEDQSTLGAFAGGKAITTVGFAAASTAIFAIVGGLLSAVKEAQLLEREFNNIEFQLKSFGQEDRIKEVNDSIRQMARDTGLAASEIAHVEFQFQGAFNGDTTRALKETAAAVELVKITGLSLTETVDAFTALTQNFDSANVSIREVGDTALGLQERFGVLADQTISFAADLAPVAEAAGFTVQELEALGAASQKYSGRSGSSLAEAFGRIIPQVQGNASELINLFQEIPSLADKVPDLSKAFAEGDIQSVFQTLIASYGQLSTVQQNQVVTLIGGRREAAALVGVLEHGAGVLDEWSGKNNDAGKQAERFATLQETLVQRLSEVSEQLKLLGVSLFESGFEDFLKQTLNLAGQVASVLTTLAKGFGGLNSELGGLPGKILLALAAMKGLQALAASNTATRLSNFLPSLPQGASGVGRGLLVNRSFPLTSPGLGESISSRGFVGTGRVVADNIASGVKEGYQSNKSLVNAAAALVAFQLIDSFFANLNAEAEQSGIDRFQGARRALDQNRELDATQRQQLQDAATTRDSGAAQFTDRLSGIPIAGNTLSGFTNAASDALGFGNPAEEQAAINEARSILNAQVADDLTAQITAIRDAGYLGNTDEFGNLLQNNIGINRTDELGITTLVPPEELLRIAEKAAAGGTLSEDEQQIFMLAQATFGDFYRNNAEFQAAVAGTVDDVNLQAATQTLAQARAKFEGNDLTRGEFASALKGAAEGAQAQIDVGIDDAARLAEEYDKVNEFRDFVSESIIKQLDLLNNIHTLRTGREHPGREAAGLAAAIRGGDLNNDDLAQAITDYLDLQKAIVEKQAAAADSVEESNAILERGRAIPKGIRVALITQQLGADIDFSDFVDGLPQELTGFFNDMEAFNDSTAKLMIAEGLTAKQARQAVVDQLIEDTEDLIKSAQQSNRLQAVGHLSDRLGRLRDIRKELGGSPNSDIADADRVRGELESNNHAAEDRAAAIQDARFSLLEAQAGDDPIALARIGVQRAQASIALAKNDEEKLLKARADLISAQSTLRDAELSLIESRFDLAAAYAADDPVATANIAIQKAQFQLNSATNEGERLAAQIAIVQAQRQLRDSINDIYDSQFDLVDAYVSNDPVKAAQAGLARANAAVARARNAAERNRALANKINAERALKDAINDVLNSQVEVAIAISDVAGNTVKSSQLALQLAVQKLRQLQSAGAGKADLNRAKADVITASGAVRDSILADRQGYYQFLFDMGQITQGQLIEYLQSLLAIPNLTKQQIQDIQLQIKQLRDQLGQDFQYNLPTSLALPTLYQVQRVDQTGSRAGVTDNRQVQINVNVASSVDLAELERVLANSVGTPVNGVVARKY